LGNSRRRNEESENGDKHAHGRAFTWKDVIVLERYKRRNRHDGVWTPAESRQCQMISMR